MVNLDHHNLSPNHDRERLQIVKLLLDRKHRCSYISIKFKMAYIYGVYAIPMREGGFIVLEVSWFCVAAKSAQIWPEVISLHFRSSLWCSSLLQTVSAPISETVIFWPLNFNIQHGRCWCMFVIGTWEAVTDTLLHGSTSTKSIRAAC